MQNALGLNQKVFQVKVRRLGPMVYRMVIGVGAVCSCIMTVRPCS